MAKVFDIEKLRGSDNYHGLEKCISDPVTETKEEKLINCKAILSLSVDSSLYVHISNCENEAEIWNTLQRLFEDKGLSRKIGLLRNLISVRLETCDNMQDYIDSK